MNNGCICCTVRGDLVRILSKITKRKAKLDGVIIETTGMADPAPVAQTFFMDPSIEQTCRCAQPKPTETNRSQSG
eukprot:SAG31_NODE_4668_length_3047_cov_1.961330_5_plen_75_part_00